MFLPYALTVGVLVVLHVVDKRDRRRGFARATDRLAMVKQPGAKGNRQPNHQWFGGRTVGDSPILSSSGPPR
jgi:hypothetical protein